MTSDEKIKSVEETRLATLTSNHLKQQDPELDDFNSKFKVVYEDQFLKWLKTLNKNDQINATSLPTKIYDKDTYEDDSTTLVFYFDSIEYDDSCQDVDKLHVNAVNAFSFDKSICIKFTPILVEHYGPYFGTHIFASAYSTGRQSNNTQMKEDNNNYEEVQTEYFFLDLPIHLYHQID